MSEPTLDDVKRLLEWSPPLGVISVYLRVEPGDRAAGWRTELRNELAHVREQNQASGHDAEQALRATAERIGERFENGDRPPPGRGELGFVEVARKPAREHWWTTQVAPAVTAVTHRQAGPLIAPLIPLVESGGRRGIAVLSAERARLLDWSPGHLEETHDWELTLTSGDWRERKAARVADPATSQGVTAAGHDQFEDRLAENRQRFIAECGRLAAQSAAEHDWHQLIVFGGGPQVERFREAFGSTPELQVGGDAGLISTPRGKLEEVIEDAIARLDAERERQLVERILGEVRGGTHGSAGPQETLEALDQGRVDHLVVAAGLEPEDLVRRALATGAKVTAVSGEAAELLEPAGGVASLLRY